MKHKAILMIISVLMLCAFIANVAAFAGAEDIKKRMKARLSTIVSLKNQGIIGESNEGYIVYMGNARPQQDVINAENSDRKFVYEAIANKQGSTADVVGKRRALQIAEKADPGEWLQDTNGNWYKK